MRPRIDRCRRRAGLTLIELLVTMMILALVLGAGLGVFANLDLGQRGALGLVKSVLRSAQNTAVARQVPARAWLDLERGTIRAQVLVVIGTWHFESESLEGAFGLAGLHKGSQLVDDGYLGKALGLSDPRGGASALFAVDESSAFDFRDGFALEFALRREGAGAGQLMRFGDVAWVELDGQDRLRAGFVPSVEDRGGLALQGAAAIAETGPGALTPGSWARVQVIYDRRELVVLVDGVLLARLIEEAPVWPLNGRLVLGDPRQLLPVSIDSLVVSAVEAGEEAALPKTVRFAADTPPVIYFDAGGQLDRGRHLGPQILGLVFEDGERRDLRVGVYGTVDG